MKTSLSLLALLVVSSATLSAQTVNRLLQETNRNFPKNLAREHLGARILDADVPIKAGGADINTSRAALLCADPSVGFPLTVGRTDVLIDLGRPQICDRVSFANKGVDGKVTVRAAQTWDELEQGNFSAQAYAVFDPSTGAPVVRLGGVDCRYLKIEFDVAQAGRIYDFGAYGPGKELQYQLRVGGSGGKGKNSGGSITGINITSPYTGADVIYTSSGAVSDTWKMVDEDATTSFNFDPEDQSAVTIVHLANSIRLNYADVLMDAPAAGVIEIFVLKELPETKDWKDKTNLDLTFLDGLKPNGTAAHPAGRVAKAVGLNDAEGQYLIYRFRQTGTASFLPGFLQMFSTLGAGNISVINLGAFSADMTLNDFEVGEEGGQAGENNGYMPVVGYLHNHNGRTVNGFTDLYVPVCLAVSWNGRENIPEYVIEALNKYMERIDNYEACTSRVLDHLAEIVVYGDPVAP